MSNLKKAAPSVEVELGGKKRNLVFTLRAFSLIEEKTGKNTLNGEVFGTMNATQLIAVIWAALQKEDKNLTIEEVGDMLDLSDIPVLTAAIEKAFDQATPEAPKKAVAAEQGSKEIPAPVTQ